jgi:hypothetical protein
MTYISAAGADGISGFVAYGKYLYDDPTIQRFASDFCAMLAACAGNPLVRVEALTSG